MEYKLDDFFQVILDSNLNLRLHIRMFKESKSDEFIPTQQIL